MAKQVADNILTADAIRRGIVKSTVVEGISEGGGPGTIYYKSPSASVLMDFLNTPDRDDGSEEGKRAKYARIEKMIALAAGSLVNPDGSPMFTPEEMQSVPIDSIMSIVTAISSARGDEGNGLSEAADSSASPIDLPEN